MRHIRHVPSLQPRMADETIRPAAPPLTIRLLGDTTIACGEAARALPKSRKTRALLTFLALEAGPHRRERLCDLLWDSAADPRAALRWSLAKLRPVLETPRGQALRTDAGLIGLDPSLVTVDVLQVSAPLQQPLEVLPDAQLGSIETALAAGLPHDLDLAGSDRFQLWIEGQREVMRSLHRRVLDEQAARACQGDEALARARKRAAHDPLDTAANAHLLARSAEVDGHRHARTAFDAMRARYRAEGVSDHGLVAAWRRLGDDSPLVLPDKPSVAVLGFSDLGGHEGGPVLAEGLAADLTAMLGRLRGLFVTARASSSRFAAGSNDLARAGRLLGVRYLVHGTTQRLDKRVRITVTLADALASAVLWTERFDRPLDDLFSVQDDVSAAIASAIEPEIERAEAERSRLKPPEDLSAWECYHRAMWHCFRFTAPHTEQAHRLLQRALKLEGGFARAHAGLSFVHYSRAFLDAVRQPEAEVEQALEHGRLSVELDPRDAIGHWTVGRALFLAREHDTALQAIDRSLLANPNFAQGHYALGFIRAHVGAGLQALPELAAAERLSPYDPLLFAMESSRAISLAIGGHYDDAAQWSVRATREPNAHFHIHAIAAACLSLAGREAESRGFAQRACTDHPGYSVRVFERSFPHKHPEHRDVMASALRVAGIPESAG